jgi:hypothetical protein
VGYALGPARLLSCFRPPSPSLLTILPPVPHNVARFSLRRSSLALPKWRTAWLWALVTRFSLQSFITSFSFPPAPSLTLSPPISSMPNCPIHTRSFATSSSTSFYAKFSSVTLVVFCIFPASIQGFINCTNVSRHPCASNTRRAYYRACHSQHAVNFSLTDFTALPYSDRMGILGARATEDDGSTQWIRFPQKAGREC